MLENLKVSRNNLIREEKGGSFSLFVAARLLTRLHAYMDLYLLF